MTLHALASCNRRVLGRAPRRRILRARLWPSCAAVLLLWLSGCRGGGGPAPVVEPGVFELMATQPAAEVVSAEMVQPLVESDRHYIVIGDRGQETLVERRRRADQYDAQWANSTGKGRTEFWTHDDEGNLVLTAAIDYAESALTRFEPPLVIAWASLAPGEQRESTAAMRVLDLRDPTRVREQGNAVQRVSYVHDQAVRLPDADAIAHVLELEFEADLRLADVRRAETIHIVPGRGVVIRHSSERLVVLGLLPSTKEQTIVLERIEE